MSPVALGATWITSAEHHRTGTALPVLATVVEVDRPLASARLSLACLGVLRVSIDGEAVSDDVLEPGYADWAREAEHTGWDVTHLLGPGTHVLRIDLAGGLYRSQRHDDRWTKITTDLGDVAVAAALELHDADGSRVLTTGPHWRSTTGAVLRSDFVGGEDHDLRREPDASPAGLAGWEPAVPASVPAGLSLVARSTPPLRVVDRLPARSVTRVGEALVVDLGQNAAGWPVLDLPAGATVRLRPAELLTAEGAVDVRTQGWGPVFHTVRTAHEPVRWHPAFMYNGLRYLEVVGLDDLDPAAVRVDVVAAAVDEAGGFDCSDARLGDIWRITRHAIRSNMMSVFTDCPQREKLGYLEQVHLLHDLLVRTYDCGAILDRMLQLTVGAQRDNGSIGLYAPEWQEFPDPWRGDPNWGGAVVLLPLARHRTTGDVAPVAAAWPAARRYLDHLLGERDERGVLTYGLGDFNGASVQKFRSVPLVSTASLHGLLRSAAEGADLLGETAEAARLRTEADEVAAAFARVFVDDAGRIGDDLIGEVVFAAHAGLAPAGTVDRIADRIRADGHVLDVGEVAMAHLVEMLAAAGHHDVLLGITRVTDEPSYGYMLAHGATTLTETWDGPTFGFSQNHFMNGAIATWFHEHVVGIRQAPGSTGWSDPLVAPSLVGALTSASGWYDAPTGRITASWSVVDGEVTVHGSAPAATLVLPSGRRLPVSGDFSHAERVGA